MRITLNKVIIVDKQICKFLQKILYIYNIYTDSTKYIYLYRLVVILPLHDIINKQKLIYLVCKITDSITIYIKKLNYLPLLINDYI